MAGEFGPLSALEIASSKQQRADNKCQSPEPGQPSPWKGEVTEGADALSVLTGSPALLWREVRDRRARFRRKELLTYRSTGGMG